VKSHANNFDQNVWVSSDFLYLWRVRWTIFICNLAFDFVKLKYIEWRFFVDFSCVRSNNFAGSHAQKGIIPWCDGPLKQNISSRPDRSFPTFFCNPLSVGIFGFLQEIIPFCLLIIRNFKLLCSVCNKLSFLSFFACRCEIGECDGDAGRESTTKASFRQPGAPSSHLECFDGDFICCPDGWCAEWSTANIAECESASRFSNLYAIFADWTLKKTKRWR